MAKAKKTGTKKHNWLAGPNNKVVMFDDDHAAYLAICGCRHLTPAVEAEMDKMLGVNVSVPSREEVIARNMPGVDDVEMLDMDDIPSSWDSELVEAEAEAEGPTEADLVEIESEA